VCCVPSLPQDFPTGDAIHAPVRVAGVLLIKWSYPRRRGASESSAAPPARLAAPLILAGEPQWLRPAAAGSRGALQWAVGAGFAAALAVVWWLAARAHRADRLARSRRTVYDAGLAPVSDRRDFPQ
ncbi:MAG TPA: hypothetical protein PJ982_17150, partial [Lacipirellulaceae bacterium]|nr:hypothetical protein [Lacipirellulaceae bacterium]